VFVEIVAVSADIQFPDRNGMAPDILENGSKAFRQKDAAFLDSNQNDGIAAFILLHDFVGNAGEDSMNGLGV